MDTPKNISEDNMDGITVGNHSRRDKTIIFLIALLARAALGWIFFGSIDMLNTISNSQMMLRGEPIILPYLPVIPAFIWLGGVLNALTPMPLTFSYKLVPILFDALLAVLIYDIAANRSSRWAFSAGLFYALCPVSLIITSLHSQWDSIPIFIMLLSFHIREHYRKTPGGLWLFGALFGLSVFVKPISLLFAPVCLLPFDCAADAHGRLWRKCEEGLCTSSTQSISIQGENSPRISGLYSYGIIGLVALTFVVALLDPSSAILFAALPLALIVYLVFAKREIVRSILNYFQQQMWIGIGLLCITAICITLFMLFHCSIGISINKITKYADSGIQIFGLPFAYPFSLLPFFKTRFWLFLATPIMALPYLEGKLQTFEMLTAIAALIIGITGLSPQYLLWIIPLLLIIQPPSTRGEEKWGMRAALVIGTLMITAFLLLYYMSPYASYMHFENMSTMATLREYRWLMPPDFFSTKTWIPLIRTMGNYLIPLASLILLVSLLYHKPVMGKGSHLKGRIIGEEVHIEMPVFRPEQSVYLGVIILIGIILAITALCVNSSHLVSALQARVNHIPTDYAIQSYQDFASFNLRYRGEYGRSSIVNIITLLSLLAIGGGILILWPPHARQHPSPFTPHLEEDVG